MAERNELKLSSREEMNAWMRVSGWESLAMLQRRKDKDLTVCLMGWSKEREESRITPRL